MRDTSRGVVLGLMGAALLTAAGGGQVEARADPCCQLTDRENEVIVSQPDGCQLGKGGLTITPDTAAHIVILDLEGIDGE